MIRFGEQLRAWRKKAGVSQAALERTIGKNRGWVNAQEKGGTKPPDKATCQEIAQALDLSDRLVWGTARAERLQDQAKLGELAGALGQAGHVRRIEFDHLRKQQPLAGDARTGERGLDALVDQPLVGRVLIDDDDAVLGLGDDVGLVNLAARRAQRIG